MTTPPKHNARGETRCALCGVYKPADAFYPSRTHRCYCIACERVYSRDLANAKYRHDPEYNARHRAYASNRAKRIAAEHRAEMTERAEQVAAIIATLKRRGLTLSEIADLTGTSHASVSCWRRRLTVPQESVEARMLHLLIATTGWPDTVRARGVHASPHPRLPELRRVMDPVIADNPLYFNAKRKVAA